MTRYVTAVYLLCGGLVLTTAPIRGQVPTVTGSPAIADTVARLFGEVARATSALDVDRLLGYYADGDALTYVAQGRVTRSKTAFRNLVETQLRALASADLRWQDVYVDVLTPDVAVATATYHFTAGFPDGGSARTTGSYMCIFERREGRWAIRYSSHTFPPPQP